MDGPKLPDPKEPRRQISANLPISLLRKMDDLARKHEISRTDLLIYGMSWVIERLKGQDDLPAKD